MLKLALLSLPRDALIKRLAAKSRGAANFNLPYYCRNLCGSRVESEKMLVDVDVERCRQYKIQRLRADRSFIRVGRPCSKHAYRNELYSKFFSPSMHYHLLPSRLTVIRGLPAAVFTFPDFVIVRLHEGVWMSFRPPPRSDYNAVMAQIRVTVTAALEAEREAPNGFQYRPNRDPGTDDVWHAKSFGVGCGEGDN